MAKNLQNDDGKLEALNSLVQLAERAGKAWNLDMSAVVRKLHKLGATAGDPGRPKTKEEKAAKPMSEARRNELLANYDAGAAILRDRQRAAAGVA